MPDEDRTLQREDRETDVAPDALDVQPPSSADAVTRESNGRTGGSKSEQVNAAEAETHRTADAMQFSTPDRLGERTEKEESFGIITERLLNSARDDSIFRVMNVV